MIMQIEEGGTKGGIIIPKDSSEKIFMQVEAVQQLKIGRKRKANRALNPKRNKFFGGQKQLRDSLCKIEKTKACMFRSSCKMEG